jgi:hypothetical protein
MPAVLRQLHVHTSKSFRWVRAILGNPCGCTDNAMPYSLSTSNVQYMLQHQDKKFLSSSLPPCFFTKLHIHGPFLETRTRRVTSTKIPNFSFGVVFDLEVAHIREMIHQVMSLAITYLTAAIQQ